MGFMILGSRLTWPLCSFEKDGAPRSIGSVKLGHCLLPSELGCKKKVNVGRLTTKG